MKLFCDDVPLPALACAAALLGAACMPTDGDVATYLLIAQAARQPGSTTLETIVVLQQRGGKFLRLKTQGGTFQLPGDASTTQARTSACVAALPDGELGFYSITPANGECTLSVALLGEGAECSGTLLQNKIIPVSSTRTVVEATTSGSGGSGGSGGTSASSSGTTSTSSTGGK
jgi:uncharacterized membrane protein YgcG